MMLHFVSEKARIVLNAKPVMVLAFSGVDDFGNEFAIRYNNDVIPLAQCEDDPIAAVTFHVPLNVCMNVQAFCEANNHEAVH